MAGRTRERLRRHLEVLEFFLGQQFAVAKQHTLFADEQTRTSAPGRHPARWFAVALVPDKLERWLRANRRESVSRDQRRGREFLVRFRHIGGNGFNGQRRQRTAAAAVRTPEIEHGKGHVVVVAAEVARGAVAKIPPAIPARSRKIGGVERTLRRGTKPQVPMHV